MIGGRVRVRSAGLLQVQYVLALYLTLLHLQWILCVNEINIQLAERTLTQQPRYVCVSCISMPHINIFVSSIGTALCSACE